MTARRRRAELEQLYAAARPALTQALHAAGYPDAADAVQEAFVQAVVHWRKVSRTTIRSRGSAGSRSTAATTGAARGNGRKRCSSAWPPSATAPVPVVETDDDLAALVAALPQQQRLALSLFYFADLSVAEVADAMKLSEGAVKYHLHAARASSPAPGSLAMTPDDLSVPGDRRDRACGPRRTSPPRGLARARTVSTGTACAPEPGAYVSSASRPGVATVTAASRGSSCRPRAWLSPGLRQPRAARRHGREQHTVDERDDDV